MRADFPPEPASAGQARRFVDVTLRAWSCDGVLDVAVLLVSELVANSVLHARTTIRVVIRLESQRLRIEVHDGDVRAPARKHYSSLSTTGRGLLMVERLATDWGVAAEDSGKSVWFELDASAKAAGDIGPLAYSLDLDDLAGLEIEGDQPSSEPGDVPGGDSPSGLRMLVGAGIR